MPRPLFVYGSLIIPDVLDALLGRRPRQVEASLPGWSARCLRGVAYPGLVADASSSAAGLVLDDLTAREIALIDDWESDFYERERVHPLVDGRPIEADAYVLPAHEIGRHAEPREWTVDVLRPELDDFCAQTRVFRDAWLARSRQD